MIKRAIPFSSKLLKEERSSRAGDSIAKVRSEIRREVSIKRVDGFFEREDGGTEDLASRSGRITVLTSAASQQRQQQQQRQAYPQKYSRQRQYPQQQYPQQYSQQEQQQQQQQQEKHRGAWSGDSPPSRLGGSD